MYDVQPLHKRTGPLLNVCKRITQVIGSWRNDIQVPSFPVLPPPFFSLELPKSETAVLSWLGKTLCPPDCLPTQLNSRAPVCGVGEVVCGLHQRCRKDFLIGGGHSLKVHIE